MRPGNDSTGAVRRQLREEAEQRQSGERTDGQRRREEAAQGQPAGKAEQTMDLLEKLKQHHPSLVGIERYKKFAVCIPLIETPEGYQLLFQVRSSKIDRQPGDICFPGGMLEPGESARDGAVRETCEELLVEPGQVEVVSKMDMLVEDGNMLIYTFAAVLHDYRNTYSPEEVSQVFTVPLQYLLETEPELYFTTEHTVPDDNFPFERIRGGKNYPWRKKREEMYFYAWKDRVIWGITAKILESFLNACR